ncbi:MAG: UDP-N-acetylmuramoyl-L-alanine--D-glutamate ligase [Flavobacteriaceae bacterium]|nr:UDP-N-acetylmuramoyl-L-alanine--D-glutamate ligase [Flavobacteriaceae bacterium]
MSKKIVILGAGESGVGAALLAKQKGYDVFVSDKGKIAEKYEQELHDNSIDFEQGTHTFNKVFEADLVVKSPGIPDTIQLIQELISKGVPVISEIEFAAKYTNGYKICVTGTDGKTTTASLIYHILYRAGMDVSLSGNIGKSFARQILEKDTEYYVLEISSFQLDNMFDFKAEIAVMTNISADHLDRYDYKIENYIASKFRILNNQTSDDIFIYCADSENIINNLPDYSVKAKQFPFSYFSKQIPGAYVDNKQIFVKTNQNHILNMNLNELSLKGRHNAYNSMAAAIAGDVLDLSNDIVRESLSDFVNIEHRLENLGQIGGIEFINDSKATNVNAAWYALESQENPIVWIAGGQDKGNDYSMLQGLVKDKVKIIVCIGMDNRKIHEAFSNDVDMIVNTTSMPEAVHVAYKLAAKGDCVLLSPACASFDFYENYEDRGRQFKRAVKNL